MWLSWIVVLSGAPGAAPVPELSDMADLIPKAVIDMRYATQDNFFGMKAYPVARCLLRPSLAQKLVKAQAWLDAKHPGLRLMFKDCYRPNSVQKLLWNAVKGTPKRRYVANPNTKTGSIHSYGAAVDVTLADAEGHELDMGTPFDHLGPEAEPRHEARLLKAKRLSRDQINNRLILRHAMRKGAKIRMIRNEWWHFNEYSAKEIRSHYSRLDVPLEAIPHSRAPNPAKRGQPLENRIDSSSR